MTTKSDAAQANTERGKNTGLSEERLRGLISAKLFEINCDHNGEDEAEGINGVRRDIISALTELLSVRARLALLDAAIESGAVEAGADAVLYRNRVEILDDKMRLRNMTHAAALRRLNGRE